MTSILDGVDLRTQLAGANRLELLLFRLSGKQLFGINVFKVQEVIQCPPLTKIPKANPVVRGIANMRGKTISVMDLSMAIGSVPLDDIDNRFVIVTEYNCNTQGFMVGSVDRIINMNWEDIKPPPKGAAASSYMTAVTQVDKELVEIIDVEKVMSEVLGASELIDSQSLLEGLDSSKQHILVVDDSVVARHQVTSVLDQLGVTYTECRNGREALDQLRLWASEGRDLLPWLALVISDIEMPSMDGYSLTSAIRKEPGMESLYVILHSSLSGVFNESMTSKVGANQFLPKYEPNVLAKAVSDRLRVHQQEHGLDD
ncbi:chemotaxis protein CheV [Magnetovirga frankeli]|uniref:chemotaxis protein n=1 Tax=Magnetovirga frankeli TaxID=947516 RepID=UPI001293098E|nr:chemotaxis protein CheV [gamma proteobacterium SS-5]